MRPILGPLVTVALLLVSASAVRAQTFPVTGTAGFETGLRALARLQVNTAWDIGVFWGDGDESPGMYRCFNPVAAPRDCFVYGTHAYPAPGSYTITISYVPPGLFQSRTTVTTSATVAPVGEFVILSIGDSVASGEGNPVVPFVGGGSMWSPRDVGFWDDPGSNYLLPDNGTVERAEEQLPCHRSVSAGPVRAAGGVAATNTVTFVHLACSGATVTATPENRSNLVRQLRLARQKLGRIDVLLISGGANNLTFRKKGPFGFFTGAIGMGFGDAILRCLRGANGREAGLFAGACDEDQDFRNDMRDSIEGNPNRTETDDNTGWVYRFPGLARMYADLDKVIHCIRFEDGTAEPNCSEAQVPRLVLITEYYDPTHDENGEFSGIGCPDAGINSDEWEYLYLGIMRRLNHHVRLSPWHAVVGPEAAFLRHGYCAGTDRWVVRAVESFDNQGDKFGSAHPNGRGQADYGDWIYDSVVRLNPPVTSASATTAGQPYTFDTWTAQAVEVTLEARNPIRESGVGRIWYAVDNPACAGRDGCSIYTGPFLIDTSGAHTVTFFSENLWGGFEAARSVMVRIDNDPPRMTCNATPKALWPPTGRMVRVRTTVEVIDDDGSPVPFVLVSITASEGDAERDIRGFVVGTADTRGWLRAKRSGFGRGREYTLTYESTDDRGNTGSCTVVITVPHDRRTHRK